MGNGGSSCDAAHVAVEFLHPVTAGRPALAAINLAADTATLSALGNDLGFEHVFLRQIVAQARAGDGLIGVSTSGNSANLLAAFAKAKEIGHGHRRAVPAAMAAGCGASGAVDHCLVVPTTVDPSHSGDATSSRIISCGTWCTRCWRRPARIEPPDEVRRRVPRPRQGKCAGREIEALARTIDIARGRSRSWRCAAATRTLSSATASRRMLPEQIELVHGPGCPVCVLPMGRIDDCIAIAAQPGVILTTFGDAMRVPGSRGSLLQAKADGADVRMVYSPTDALAIARKNPGPRGRVLRARLRDHDAVHRADGPGGRARRHRQFLRVLQPHHDRADDQGHPGQPGSADRRLSRPRPRVAW